MPSIGHFNRTYLDYDGEKSSVGIYHDVMTTGNIVALQAAMLTLYGAIDALCKGVPESYRFENIYTLVAAPPNDAWAQREIKWRVDYHDTTTGKPYRLEIPCADLDNLDPNDRAHAFIGDADKVDDFVTAFEAIAKSQDGNAVVVDEITAVGRSL